MKELETKFHKDMINIYKKADEELGYRATRFLQMLSEFGGVETAKRLVTKDGGTDGFRVLWENNKLELSVEALVLKEEYKPLFAEEIRQICKDRLTEYGYYK